MSKVKPLDRDRMRKRVVREILRQGLPIGPMARRLMEAKDFRLSLSGELDLDEGMMSYKIEGEEADEAVDVPSSLISLAGPSSVDLPVIRVSVIADPDAALLDYIEEEFDGDMESFSEDGWTDELVELLISEVSPKGDLGDVDVEWVDLDPPYEFYLTLHFTEATEPDFDYDDEE